MPNNLVPNTDLNKTSDAIIKKSLIETDITTLWSALTDHSKFGDWFMVAIDGPFVEGELSHGQFTFEGYEHFKWVARVAKIEPEILFSFYWSPAMDMEDVEFSNRPQTLVEFILEPQSDGIILTIKESGFLAMKDEAQRMEALERNASGWEAQMENIAAYVASTSP